MASASRSLKVGKYAGHELFHFNGSLRRSSLAQKIALAIQEIVINETKGNTIFSDYLLCFKL